MDEKQKTKIYRRIEELLESERNEKSRKEIEAYLIGTKGPTSLTGYIGEQFIPIPDKQFYNELFTPKELDTLNRIAARFRETSTQEIIDLSHHEKAWIDNEKEKKLIDYRYGFELEEI